MPIEQVGLLIIIAGFVQILMSFIWRGKSF